MGPIRIGLLVALYSAFRPVCWHDGRHVDDYGDTLSPTGIVRMACGGNSLVLAFDSRLPMTMHMAHTAIVSAMLPL